MAPASTFAVAQWRALGTYVQLVMADRDQADAIVARAGELLDRLEHCCSRFRPDSALSRVNQGAGDWVPADELLLQAVTVALDAAVWTDGLVDPTLGLVLAGLGYDRDLAEVRRTGAATAIPATRTPTTWRQVELDPDGAIRLPFGVALDLGATGKAFAADLLAQRLPREFGTDLIVSLGGDVAVGRAEHPGNPTAEPVAWQIIVCETPERTTTGAGVPGPPNEQEERVTLPSGGLATSSVVRRRWRAGDDERHHLIDPRTGLPARSTWRTVSVGAGDCVTANAASTAAIVLADRAVDWLTAREVSARLVDQTGDLVYLGSWPTSAARLRNQRAT